jgi:hypothetical protein
MTRNFLSSFTHQRWGKRPPPSLSSCLLTLAAGRLTRILFRKPLAPAHRPESHVRRGKLSGHNHRRISEPRLAGRVAATRPLWMCITGRTIVRFARRATAKCVINPGAEFTRRGHGSEPGELPQTQPCPCSSLRTSCADWRAGCSTRCGIWRRRGGRPRPCSLSAVPLCRSYRR